MPVTGVPVADSSQDRQQKQTTKKGAVTDSSLLQILSDEGQLPEVYPRQPETGNRQPGNRKPATILIPLP
jgi:hypothetical protein